MSLRRWSLTFVAAFAFVWISNGADAPGIQLVRESGSDTLHGIANTTHGAIKWSHGAFLYMESGYPPAFYTLDREGNWIYSAAFRAPNGALAWSNDYDRETDGSIVLAGQYSSDQGAVPFLAWISVDGKTQRLVPTTPYFPYMLSVAPDGTVWTIGHEMINGDPKAPGLEPDAGVLRHFDGTGKLLGSALPQSRFKTSHEQFRLHSGLSSPRAIVSAGTDLERVTGNTSRYRRRRWQCRATPGCSRLPRDTTGPAGWQCRTLEW
jgi:hypothetical protein